MRRMGVLVEYALGALVACLERVSSSSECCDTNFRKCLKMASLGGCFIGHKAHEIYGRRLWIESVAKLPVNPGVHFYLGVVRFNRLVESL